MPRAHNVTLAEIHRCIAVSPFTKNAKAFLVVVYVVEKGKETTAMKRQSYPFNQTPTKEKVDEYLSKFRVPGTSYITLWYDCTGATPKLHEPEEAKKQMVLIRNRYRAAHGLGPTRVGTSILSIDGNAAKKEKRKLNKTK